MRLFVTGGSGSLGRELVPSAREAGHEVMAPSHDEFDVTDPNHVGRLANGDFGEFDWVVNLAAFTDVDKAESEARLTTELNTIAPGYLSSAAMTVGARMLHVSTDYVFDGTAHEPYTEDAETRPLQLYGRTKLEGEASVLSSHANALVVRVSWLFGKSGRSFVSTMVNALKAGKTLRVTSDQFGRPTATADLAPKMVRLMELNPEPGIFHLCGPEPIGRYDYALRIFQRMNAIAGVPIPEVTPVKSSEVPTPAVRPLYSVLDTSKADALLGPMPPLDEALDKVLPSLGTL